MRMKRDRLATISALSLPIIGGMVSQNVLNLVDTWMVSELGKESLAAVGQGSYLNFASIAFITGISVGVQAMASRRKGEGLDDETAVPLNGGLLLVLCIAIPMSIVLFLAAPYIFPVLSNDSAVITIGTEYYRMRLLAMVAVGANFAFRGYWNGVSMSRLYLRTLLIMHVCNVGISYVLIFGKLGLPALGATGAGLGTTIATFIGTGTYFILGRGYARNAGFLRAIPSWATIKSMFRLSIPNGLQQTAFAFGFTVLFRIISSVGTTEAAAATVLVNIMLVAILPGLGLGLASASLVGQALGRGDVEDAARWGWDVVRVASMIVALIGMVMFFGAEPILGIFLDTQPEVLEVAVAPLRLVGATVVLDAIGMVLLNSIMGAGATLLAATVSTAFQWFLFLPAAYLVGPVLGFGLIGIWGAQVGYRLLQAVVMAILWRSRRWAHVKV